MYIPEWFTDWPLWCPPHPPPPILDDRKWILIAFLAISDKYSTFIFWFCSQNGCRRPFWITENHFWSHFSPFQINTQLWFFSQNVCRRPFWMTENHFWSHFSSFQINTQLLYFCSQNGYWRPFWMTENRFRSHFSPYQINTQLWFFWFFSQMAAAAILDDRKSLSITFLAISDQYATLIFFFFTKRLFWMTENHFRSHFSPFQIDT